MIRALRSFILLTSIALGSAAFATGCACSEQDDGSTKCETTKQFTGTPRDRSADWTAGQSIRINVDGGNVRIGDASTSITVLQGSENDVVKAKFVPFVSGTDEDKDKLVAQMEKNLVTEISSSNGEVVVTVDREGTVASSLSAYVILTLPANFAGGLVATSESGGVRIEAANGPVDVTTSNADVLVQGTIAGHVNVTTSNGDVTVDTDNAITGADTANIKTDRNIGFYIPANSLARIDARSGADGRVFVSPATLPEGWALTDDQYNDGGDLVSGVLSSLPIETEALNPTVALDNTEFTFAEISIKLK